MKKWIAAVLCVAMILPFLGWSPWTVKSAAEEVASPVTYEESFDYTGFGAAIYDSSNVWQTEYLDNKSTEAYGYYAATQPQPVSGALRFNEGDGVRLNWTKLQDFATFSADKTYTLTFDVTVTDFGDNKSINASSNPSDKTWNRELFFGPAGYFNQVEMRSGRTANDTGSSPKPLGIRAGNVNGGSTESWCDAGLYTLNTVYSCTVQWIPAEKKIATTVKNGDTVIVQGYRTNDNYATVNKYMNSFVWRCEDGVFNLDNVVLTDGTKTYTQYFDPNTMVFSGLWGLEDVQKTDAIAPVLENGIMKMTDKNSVRFNWTKVPNVGAFDPAKIYTFEFDFNVTDSGDGSLWNTKDYTRALYVAFGGYYTVLEINSTGGLVKCPDNPSDTYTEAKYANQTLHCKIIWEGSVFTVAVTNAEGEVLFSGARSNSNFTDMTAKSASMTNLVLRCEDGGVEIENFKFAAVSTPILHTADLEIPAGKQAVYKTSVHYNGSEKVTVKLGGNEVFSIDSAALKLCAKTVPGTYPAGTYGLTVRINPQQELVSVEVILPDGGVVRKGLSTLLGGTAVSVYSVNANGADAPTVTYENISLQTYQLTETEPQGSGFDANVYNLITSFSDATATRAFAWTAKTDFLSGDGMALQYRVSGTDSWTSVDAVKEAEPIESAEEDFFKCDLTGLSADTAYEYRIGKKNSSAEADWSKVYTFRTATGKEDSFTFLAVGDTQGKTWSGLTSADKGFMFAKAAFDAAFAENATPSFILHAGDVVETGGDKTLWNMYFKTLGEHGASIPHFAAVGNHDTWTYGNPFYFNHHFNHPDNGGAAALDPDKLGSITNTNLQTVIANAKETIYSYDYANAHFIVLNTGTYESQDEYLLEAQRQWLINDLEANKDAEWTVLLFHEPVYHRLGGTESRPWLYDVIEGYGVDLVLQGHSHLVTRTYPMKNGEIVTKTLTDSIPKGTGTVYMTIGSTALNHDGAGDSTQVEEMFLTVTPTATQPAYTFVTVEQDQLTVTTKQVNGLILDQFTIAKETPGLTPESGDLTVQIDPYVAAAEVYSLDILWENSDFAFDYVAGAEGTWDPAKHEFVDAVSGDWVDKDLAVTVFNHSNAAVDATLSITDGDEADGLTVQSDKETETLPTAEGTTVENAPKIVYTLTIAGTPTESIAKVASARISFAKAVKIPTKLTLKYDDRYRFPDAIDTVETLSVTSQKTGTDRADENVVTAESTLNRDVGVACGVGTALVTLKNGDAYQVTVEKAPISVFLIIGQSNAEGSTVGDNSLVYQKARNQSIVCDAGQVYTTYAWSTTGHATAVAGISSSKRLSADNAASFVAQSLTSDLSRSGTALEYPLDSFSSGNLGKAGFDSGLAWNWNKLTGEKVWVVNCAAGSSAIESWQPDYVPAAGETTPAKLNRYEMCVAMMENVKATMDAEVAAGHYELNHFAYFWLQGESNKSATEADYRAKLDNLHENLKKDVVLTGNKQPEACGIILVRAFETGNPSIDTVDNGPRLAQKAFVSQTADAFMACAVNDQWISASGVTTYWETAYPNSEYPFSVHSQAYENPTEIATVHTGIHYLQPGYNEIGIVAARSAFEFLD